MRRQSGLALIMALLLVAAAALLALTAANRSRDVAAGHVIDDATTAARAAAYGGVERARWALSRDESYTGDSVHIGRCDVEIHVRPQEDGDFDVRAIARAPAAPFAESVGEHVDVTVRAADRGLPTIVDWRE